MVKISNIDEKKLAGASYIFAFYKDVQTLTEYYAQYTNFLLELKSRYNELDLAKLTEEEKTAVTQTVRAVRVSVNKIYIQYISILSVLKTNIKADEKENIKSRCGKIKKNYIINEEDLEDFVIQINKFLLKGIIQSLLEDSQSIIESIYENGGSKEETGS